MAPKEPPPTDINPPRADDTWGTDADRPSKGSSSAASIGPYQILSVLGEGGMGTVYLAQQSEPVERTVALKVIRANLGNPVAQARFAAERQAMARLSHTNVARMFEAGTTPQGWPWFAMEHIDGDTLVEFCDDNKLSVDDRLSVFIDVCKGVQHAHQRGIMHRDLKPMNILVTRIDDKPVPKIIDFGIAKALDDSLTNQAQLTGTGMVGSPAYMSPEALQVVEGIDDVDTRTDVYSLGVILYELLAGERPFERLEGNIVEMIMSVAKQDALQPSFRLKGQSDEKRSTVAVSRGTEPIALSRKLSGDLDWIVSMAIHRDREERYSSAAELAADITRFLAHEPVLANPPTRRYRLRKFVRRNRLGVAAGTATLLAMVLGVAGTSWGIVQANKEEARATERAAMASSETAASRDVSSFMTAMFKIEENSKSDQVVLARELIDVGAGQIEIALADKPGPQARMLRVIGSIYSELGDYEESAPLLEKAVVRAKHVFGHDHTEVTSGQDALALVYARTGRGDDAERLYREALANQIRMVGSKKHPDAAISLANLAVLLKERGDLAGAIELNAEAIDIEREILGDEHPSLAISLNNQGMLELERGHPEPAEKLLQEAVSIARVSLDAHSPYTLSFKSNLANALRESGRFAEAETLLAQNHRALLDHSGAADPGTLRANEALVQLRIEVGEPTSAP